MKLFIALFAALVCMSVVSVSHADNGRAPSRMARTEVRCMSNDTGHGVCIVSAPTTRVSPVRHVRRQRIIIRITHIAYLRNAYAVLSYNDMSRLSGDAIASLPSGTM